MNIEKGSWGWEEVYDIVLIIYDDFVVVNVVLEFGNLFIYNRGLFFCYSFLLNEDLEVYKYKINI